MCRWPLALRFIKGAIHGVIALPLALHALFAALVVFIDQNLDGNLGLPASIVVWPNWDLRVEIQPANTLALDPEPFNRRGSHAGESPSSTHQLSLANAHKVFRNQTSYNRFWDGRNHLTVIITSVRNLTRSFLLCSHPTSATDPTPSASPADRAETERVIRILIAILYATKNHLRAEWGSAIIPGTAVSKSTGDATMKPEYSELLPKGLEGADDKGLGLPLQLTFFVEQYIQRCFDKGFFHAPQASQMQVQLNTLVHAYGMMETIRLTPIPVAHLYIILPVLVPNLSSSHTKTPPASTKNKSLPYLAASSPSPSSTKWAGGPSPSSSSSSSPSTASTASPPSSKTLLATTATISRRILSSRILGARLRCWWRSGSAWGRREGTCLWGRWAGWMDLGVEFWKELGMGVRRGNPRRRIWSWEGKGCGLRQPRSECVFNDTLAVALMCFWSSSKESPSLSMCLG